MRGLGWVEEVFQGWGGLEDGLDPALLGRVWAHSFRVVDGLADCTFEELECFPGAVVGCDEDDALDEGAPFPECSTVCCRWEYVDDPCRMAFANTSANVFLFYQVEVFDFN